jgi:hypothetical protein
MSMQLMAPVHAQEMWGGVNHWVVGAITLLILLAGLGVLIAFGGGREHS